MLLPLPINRSYWAEFNEEELQAFTEALFKHYRIAGFPYYNKSLTEQLLALEEMNVFCCQNRMINDEGVIKQTMHCLATAWTYFPHSWEVKCGTMKTPMEIFNNDEQFKKLIRKQLKMEDHIGNTRIRSRMNNFTSTQNVSNFRPTAARAIYDHFCTPQSVVWDMSCGYGGRLLGAISSPNVGTYIGTDPCVKTYEGLIKLNNNLNVIKPNLYENIWDEEEEDTRTKVFLHCKGSEVFLPEKESLDFCFTSPPYFDTEKYDTDETQSYIKFPTKESWLHGFLMQTVENCLHGLKSKKHLVINIANVKTYKNLESDLLTQMKKMPVTRLKNMHLQLASMSKEWKYEPVFIFQKN